jgi:hypothetical protein
VSGTWESRGATDLSDKTVMILADWNRHVGFRVQAIGGLEYACRVWGLGFGLLADWNMHLWFSVLGSRLLADWDTVGM